MLPSWSRVVPCGWTDGRTDMTYPIVGFAIFFRRRLKTPNDRSLYACGVLKHEKNESNGKKIAQVRVGLRQLKKVTKILDILNVLDRLSMYCVN